MAFIELSNVSKSFNGNRVVDSMDMAVEENKVLGIIGTSGSGKTTLLRMLAGFEHPDNGSISVNGTQVFDKPGNVFVEPEHRGIAMVFQDLALWPHMKVKEHLSFVLDARRIPREKQDEIINDNLKIVGLGRYINSYPHELSGGEKQRLAIVRALVQKPKVLLFDEPLSNLDQILRKDVMREFIRVKEEFNITTVYVTHNYKDIIDLADEIAVMDNGGIIQMDETKTLFQNPVNNFVAEIIGRM